MLTALSIAGILLVLYIAAALVQVARLGLSLPQALLYTPIKLLYGIEDRDIAGLRKVPAPVVYVVIHRSRLDPALMLALLPDKTLHILDESSARAGWMEPFRSLAPTIAFNAEHVFVSRRLVRRLKGGGSLAVYLPDEIEPDAVAFRLYRAVARIASQADARVIVVDIAGARMLPFSLSPAGSTPRRLLPILAVRALDPLTVAEMLQRTGERFTTRAHALFDRVAEARIASADRGRTLFQALRDAADRYGNNRVILEDAAGQTFTYTELLTHARLIGRRLARIGEPGAAVGLLMAPARNSVAAFLAVQSAGRVAAMLSPQADATEMRAALASGDIGNVVVPRALKNTPAVAAIEANGGRILWLEDIEAEAGALDRLFARLLRRYPLRRRRQHDPALLLFTSGTEGRPKAVVLSNRNAVLNLLQVQSRIALTLSDRLLCLLVPHHCFGLSGGMLLPLVSGVRVQLTDARAAPSSIAIRQKPTILLGTDEELAAWAAAELPEAPLSNLRLVFSGGAPVTAGTCKAWQERFGLSILEGYGMTEMGPVTSMNSAAHSRDGTVGRLLPGVLMRLDPDTGLDGVARLSLAGPGRMLGYVVPERPGELQPADEWFDTGDLVSIDREGFVTLRGRARRLVRIGESATVQLDLVEALARELWPADRHAALAVPIAEETDELALVTTARQADGPALAARLREAGLPGVPVRVVHVEGLPRLASGKTDYEAARKLAVTVADTAA